jgi:hypothetical protein
VSADQVRAFAACLSADSAADYGRWFSIGVSLRREGQLRRDWDMFLPDWLAFSAKGGSHYKGEADCCARWDAIEPNGEITLGTLRKYAKADGPAAYAAASRGATAWVTGGDAEAALIARLAQRFRRTLGAAGSPRARPRSAPRRAAPASCSSTPPPALVA